MLVLAFVVCSASQDLGLARQSLQRVRAGRAAKRILFVLALAVFALLGVFVSDALAQAPGTPGPASPAPGSAASASAAFAPPTAAPPAPGPSFLITGFIDQLVTYSNNTSQFDNDLHRKDYLFYGRTRGRFDIIGEYGKAKAVLGLELDIVYAQTATGNSNIDPLPDATV